jgi:DNA-binding NtrC family response regulator
MAELNRKAYKPLSDDALQAMLVYDWPGNVRELRTAIEHGVVMSNSARVGLKNLPMTISGGATGLLRAGSDPSKTSESSNTPSAFSIGADLNLEKMERAMIDAALQRTGDNRTEAAELLGLSRRTLQRKLKDMDRVKHVRRALPNED